MQKPRNNKAQQELDLEQCRRSAQYFIFGDHLGERLLTKDEHDIEHPIKPFPDKLYLKAVVDLMLVSGKLIKPGEAVHALEAGVDRGILEAAHQSGIFMLEKSRQLLVTWIVCAYMLWRAKFVQHQLLLVQSKREEDAANLVFNKEPHLARISFMEIHVPRHLRSVSFPGGGSFGHIYFPNGSHIWAIPEGGDIIRSNSPSAVFSDESAFQPEFGNSYTAALPAIKGGGQYIGVSSAEPGEFQALVESV